jgi:ABC-type Fe3+ transport system permease subunit
MKNECVCACTYTCVHICACMCVCACVCLSVRVLNLHMTFSILYIHIRMTNKRKDKKIQCGKHCHVIHGKRKKSAWYFFLLTIATVALNPLLVSLYTRFRPNVGWFPGSLPIYSSHDTLLSGGGDNDGLRTGCNSKIQIQHLK